MLSFETNGNKKAEAIAIMDTMIPKVKALKGCTNCLFTMHESDNHYVLLVFWDSKENADAAAGVMGPLMIPAINKIAKEPVQPRLYEVYQNK
jgi:hypothetical protein